MVMKLIYEQSEKWWIEGRDYVISFTVKVQFVNKIVLLKRKQMVHLCVAL